MKKGLISF